MHVFDQIRRVVTSIFIASMMAEAVWRPIHKPDFLTYSQGLLQKIHRDDPEEWRMRLHPAEQAYIRQALFYERNPTDADKVIIYHAESVGIWLHQWIYQKAFFPEAVDWLPLRYSHGQEAPGSGVDRNYIMHQLHVREKTKSTWGNGYRRIDWDPEYRNHAISASVNLVSDVEAESAWQIAFGSDHLEWDRARGLSDPGDENPSEPLGQKSSIWKNQRFQQQVQMILSFITRKRGMFSNMRTQLPYAKYFKSLNEEEIAYILEETQAPFGAQYINIILQIVMDKVTADRYCYAAYPYGYINSKRHPHLSQPQYTRYQDEDVEPFTEWYAESKNFHEIKAKRSGIVEYDDPMNAEQIRCAMGIDFLKFPSSIKIKPMSPIFEDRKLMVVLNKMVKDAADELLRPSRYDPFSAWDAL
jgi:hypothetical protein